MNTEEQNQTIKCAECGGVGKITRRVPRGAIAFHGNPEDWTWETKECWRCKGDGIGRSIGLCDPSLVNPLTPMPTKPIVEEGD